MILAELFVQLWCVCVCVCLNLHVIIQPVATGTLPVEIRSVLHGAGWTPADVPPHHRGGFSSSVAQPLGKQPESSVLLTNTNHYRHSLSSKSTHTIK